jgi:hypothetical protein
MAAKKTRTSKTRAHAKTVASSGAAVRTRVRDLTVDTFRERNLSLRDVPKLVNEVLDEAVAGVDASIPQSGKNVLREVFDGLREGVNGVASAGAATARDLRDRGRSTQKDATAAAKRVRAANDDFLDAVKDFAGKATKEVRDELDALVDRAKRTQPKVAGSARRVAEAADGRMMELGGETVRAGARMARRTAGALVLGASGFLEGLADAISTRERTTAKRPAASRAKTTARPKTKTARSAKKKASKNGKR